MSRRSAIRVSCVGYGRNKVGCTVHHLDGTVTHLDGELRKGQTVEDFAESVRENYRTYVPPGYVQHFEQLRKAQGLQAMDVVRGIGARVELDDPYGGEGIYTFVTWLRGHALATREQVHAWGAVLGLSPDEVDDITERTAAAEPPVVG